MACSSVTSVPPSFFKTHRNQFFNSTATSHVPLTLSMSSTKASHTKSKAGCARCKSRHVKARSCSSYITVKLTGAKCDEVKPTCGACQRHGVPCEYTKQSALRFVSQSPGPPSRAGSVSASRPSPVQGSSETATAVFNEAARTPNHTLELHLMHHYSTVAWQTLPTCEQMSDVWSHRVPHLAFQHKILLDTILGLSSLHLLRVGRVNPIAGLDYKAIHQVYWAQAVQGQRSAVEEVDESTAETVIITASLIAFQAFVLLDEEDDGMSHGSLILWWRLARGRHFVFERCLPHTPEPQKITHLVYSMQKNQEYDLIHHGDRTAFQRSALWTTYDPEEIPDRDTYERGLDWVNMMHRDVSTNGNAAAEVCKRMLGMPAYVPDLIELVSEQRPRAMAIVGHAFAILHMFQGEMDWFLGISRRQLQALVSPLPEQWQNAVYESLPAVS